MKSIFDNLKLNQIKYLLKIVSSSKEHGYEFIRNRYSLYYHNFEATLFFLEKLCMLKKRKGKVSLVNPKYKKDNVKNALNENRVNLLLLEKLFMENSYFISNIKSYFSNFCILGEFKEYNPMTARRLQESGIRNFFMELEIVIYDEKNNHYKIATKHTKHLNKIIMNSKISQKKLDIILKNKKILGMKAELKVIDYEKTRLKKHPNLVKKIDHVSISNVGIGYDILSFEASNKGTIRCIEVKAVSNLDYKFHWSTNEIEVAQSLNEQYYLYLLPVSDNLNFDIKNIEIIRNPYKKVFCNKELWDKKEKGFCLWKK